MAGVTNTDICSTCGEEYWYDFNCRSFEYVKLAMCKCDRWRLDAEQFLKEKGLLEKFKKYHEKMENERKIEDNEEE